MAAMERTNIGQDINLNLIESEKFKTNYIGINFMSPLDGRASANSLMLKVQKRGSKNYPTMAKINRELDFLYSAYIGTKVQKFGETQIFGLCAEMLDNRYALDGSDIFGKSVDVLSDLLFNPLIENNSFKQVYVDSEKRNLKDDIAGQINNKNMYAIRKCQEIMCRDEAFAINEIGNDKDIDAITPESLYENYKFALSSYPIEVYYIGSFKNGKENIINKIKSQFIGLKREKIIKTKTSILLKAVNKGEIVEKMSVNQGKLSVGFRTGTTVSDSDYAAFALFNELYGGSPNSKLFLNVREKLSLCYYCQSRPEAHKGLLIVASGIEVANKQQALDEILKQLEEIKNMNYTAEDLKNAKSGLSDGYKTVYDDAGGLETWYIRRVLAGAVITPDEMATAVNAVSAEQVAASAKKLTLDTVYFLEGTLKGGN